MDTTPTDLDKPVPFVPFKLQAALQISLKLLDKVSYEGPTGAAVIANKALQLADALIDGYNVQLNNK